ncbi:MAG: alpha-xylosidase, partial [Methanococcaceae archaeon]
MKITIVALFFACLLLQSCAGGNSIVVEKNARFTVLTPECIRMEYSQTGNFVNNASLFAVNREISTDAFKHLTKNDTTIIETGNMRLYYYPDGQPFSEKNVRIVIKNNGQDINWVPGTKNSGNLGGTLRTVDQISGKTKLPDGLISTDGWALVDDSHRPLFEDNWVKERPEGTAADWYFFGYGRNYKAALKSLTAVAGKVPLPRKYAFGSWYSRYWPYSTEDYKNIVEEFNKNDFP